MRGENRPTRPVRSAKKRRIQITPFDKPRASRESQRSSWILDFRSWIKKPFQLTFYAVLPLLFLHLTYFFFKIPVWEVSLPISGLVAGIGSTLVVAVLVKKYFTARVSTQPDKAKKYLLNLAFITGFGYPLVLFVVAGLIYMARAGMPLSQGFEVGWVSFVAGAAWGWPLWFFSVPWAFVMVYGLARSASREKEEVLTAKDAPCHSVAESEDGRDAEED